ncbi:hypothetical protein SAMN06265371_107102 [Lutibacter agarilyticus]|uniref:Uncharacterized protein n=2 Tax=Lutibacter agarilyticus TaxID=1109740 RepID=A0A238XWQ0_9FLAO|nr:hypothetical protein SAMN06265371_107102 [Lutibacter agarilyticus]
MGIVGFVALFSGVVYLKTKRKINSWEKPQKENAEFRKQVIENQKKQEQQAYEIIQQREQQKRDSVQQLKKAEMEAQLKKTEELIKALNKEIEDE